GIGTNVSDVLLRDLARRTSGGVEFIHPGERVDEKVVAQFARAIAPRIQDMRVSFHGVEVKELAPESPPALIDGDPWLLMGRYAAPGRGHVEIRGQLRGEPFLLKVPIELADHASRPHLLKLWARERIRDLEDAQLGGRPAEAVRDRILKLALEHSLASRYTSFLAIEQRTDERRATGHPQTRVVPVHAPAGWAMFEGKDELWPSVIPMGRARTRGAIASAARGLTMAAMAPGAAKARGGITIAGFAPPMAAEPVSRDEGQGDGMLGIGFAAGVRASPSSASRSEEDAVSKLLRTQLASGLWPDGSGASEAQQVRATALALLELVRAGITTAHSQHGAQIRKAIEALLERLARAKTGKLIELAFAVALLAASGPRTRSRIKREISGRSDLGSLRAQLNSEPALRARADALAADV
ncbi:MAG TPA: VWA domain-containing protein, partial [Myxococcaceae bacterium]|nr:VWA domain-containing protein [Myxococcaceae bacterium]